jgi:hypothetical protein
VTSALLAPRLIVEIAIAFPARWGAAPAFGPADHDDLAKAPIPLEYEPDFLSLFKG